MDESMKKIEEFQLNEITEYHIYKNIAKMVKNKEDKKILQKIDEEELKNKKELEELEKLEVEDEKERK